MVGVGLKDRYRSPSPGRRKRSGVKYCERYDGNRLKGKIESVRTRRCDFMRTRMKESKVPLKGRA